MTVKRALIGLILLSVPMQAQAEQINLRFDFSVSEATGVMLYPEISALVPLGTVGWFELGYDTADLTYNPLIGFTRAINHVVFHTDNYHQEFLTGMTGPGYIGGDNRLRVNSQGDAFFMTNLAGPFVTGIIQPVEIRAALVDFAETLPNEGATFSRLPSEFTFLGGSFSFWFGPDTGLLHSTHTLRGPITSVAAVPEPSALLLIGMGALICRRATAARARR